MCLEVVPATLGVEMVSRVLRKAILVKGLGNVYAILLGEARENVMGPWPIIHALVVNILKTVGKQQRNNFYPSTLLWGDFLYIRVVWE